MITSNFLELKQTCKWLNILLTEHVLGVRISEQKLYHLVKEKCVASYTISTSKQPPSCKENSFGTPTGLHFIKEKIGDDADPGVVFKGRVNTQTHFSEYPAKEQQKNLITSRILRLQGMESGKNYGEGCDSYQRYIYIHGTNQEEHIGTPQSNGCIILKNNDVIQIYEKIPAKSLVWIQ